MSQDHINLENQPHPKIGVAISGGFVKSVAALGALEILLENNIPIHVISGTSAGAGVAAAYAADNLDVLKKRLLGPAKDYWEVIFEPAVPKQGFLKGQRTRQFFKEFVGDKNFSDMAKELYIAATDLTNLKPVILAEGSVSDAIQASVGVPGMFVPVKRGNKILTDGGNFNLIPSAVLYDSGADYVIAIDVSQQPNIFTRTLSVIYKTFGSQWSFLKLSPSFKNDNPNIIQLIWRAARLSASQIKNLHHSAYKYEVLIQPNVSGFKRWHVNKTQHLLHLGRSAAEEKIAQIKKDLNLN